MGMLNWAIIKKNKNAEEMSFVNNLDKCSYKGRKPWPY